MGASAFVDHRPRCELAAVGARSLLLAKKGGLPLSVLVGKECSVGNGVAGGGFSVLAAGNP